MNTVAILAERSAEEQRVLAEGHEQPRFIATFTDLSAPLLLLLSVARHLDAEGRRPRAVFVYGDNGEIDGIAIEAEPAQSPAIVRTVDDPRRYAVVGWLYAFQEYRCLRCKPSPPKDDQCTKVYRSDVTDDDCCESCGAPLVLDAAARAEWLDRENTRRGERADGKLWAQHDGTFARND